MGILYRLDFSSGKSYVGVTSCTARSRYNNHANDARRGSKLLVHSAWRRHGAPRMKVLAIVEDRILLEVERRAVNVFGTLNPGGYNMIEGGAESPSLYPEVRAKISRSKKGYSHPKEVIERISAKLQGRPAWNKGQKGVVKVKMSKKQKAARCKKVWETRRATGKDKWAGKGTGGHVWTEEQRRAKSEELKARFANPKERRKQSQRIAAFCKRNPDFVKRWNEAGASAKRGKPTSEETKAKMSVAMKEAWKLRRARRDFEVHPQ